MNKTAFLALIKHLQKEFTQEKINAYIENLEKLKNNNSDEAISRYKGRYMNKRTFESAAVRENRKVVEVEGEERFDNSKIEEKEVIGSVEFNSTDMLTKQRANAVDHAIYCLKWLSELTKKLNGDLAYESLEKKMDAVREHFSERYEEMYELLFSNDSWTDREKRLQEDHLANYYLAPAVLGGPTFDDHTIYWFMQAFSSAISAELAGGETASLEKSLREVVHKMAYGDLGIDQEISDAVDGLENSDSAPDIDTDLDNHIVGGKKMHYHERQREIHKARSAIEKQVFLELDKVKEIKDAETEMADLTSSFLNNWNTGKRKHSPKMTELVMKLKKYEKLMIDSSFQNGNLPKHISVEVFDSLQELTNKIRDEHRKTNAKDFHETAEFLNRVDVYCEKMARLTLCTEETINPKANMSEQVCRTRVLSDRLFKRLNSLSKGNQSPEFRKMYEALEALRSRTAGSARHLMEQMLVAKEAADSYLRAKDEERLHKTGIRYTSKGQARYDSARNIRDMLDAALGPYRLAYEKHPHLNFLKKLDSISIDKNEKHLATDTYSFPKEYYLHRAGHVLAVADQTRRIQYTVRKTTRDIKDRYDSCVEQYFYNMYLADHPEKRRKMSFEDEGVKVKEIGCNEYTYRNKIVHPYFKYFLIMQTGGLDFTDYNDLFVSMKPDDLATKEGKKKILNSQACKQLIKEGVDKKEFVVYYPKDKSDKMDERDNMDGVDEIDERVENDERTRVVIMRQGNSLPPTGIICDLYKVVSKENEYLKSIEKMTLQEARKLRTDAEGMENSVNEFVASFDYDMEDRVMSAIANRAKTDRIKALDKRINELTMERQQKEKGKSKVNHDIIENPEPIDDNKPVRHISLG